MKRLVVILGAVVVAVLPSGCAKEGCLGGDATCKVLPPCPKLKFTCDAAAATALAVQTIGSAAERPGGWDALGAKGDVKLRNSFTEVVIAGIGNQNYLDPNGGSILDLTPAGKAKDSINSIFQVVGILPGDSVRYTSMEIIDERPARVAVQVKGALDGRPGVTVYTRYELTPCDHGVRVRTEAVNGTVDNELWSLVDAYYWSGREALPFAPGPGSGFVHPSFGLLSINDVYRNLPFLAAAGHSSDDEISSIAAVSCTEPQLEGFNSDQISAAGHKRTIVPPRGSLTFERFIAVAESKGVSGAIDLALEARRQLLGEKFVTLSGKIERPGAKRLDGERETSVLVIEGTLTTDVKQRTQWTQIVPAANGTFSATVPAGKSYVVEVHSFGRKQIEKEFPSVSADTDLGTFTLPSTATMTFTVKDADTNLPLDAEIFAIPVNAEETAKVVGSLHGRFVTCSPWLGPPPGASPACNRVLVRAGIASAEIPVGQFYFYAFHGPFFSLDRQVASVNGGSGSLSFTLKKLPLQPDDTLGADLHVHGAASFDSSIPDFDRVLSFSASALEVVIATDHEVVTDYSKIAKSLGLDGTLVTVSGVETTGHIPFMKIPGYGFPLVIGHYNFWPLTSDPSLPRNGGPFDELVEPGMLFERARPLFSSGTPLIELNHPWAVPEFGRDLGFPRALSLDLRKDLPGHDDGTAQGMYVRTPAGAGFANDDHHAQEVQNGTSNELYLQYRAFWFYTLNQGRLRTGTANSDSHSLTDNTVGMPRNLVSTATKVGPGFSIDEFNRAVRAGALLGTNGPIIEAALQDSTGALKPYGLAPFKPKEDGRLHVKVSSAPWVPVRQLRFVVNGLVVKTIDTLNQAENALGTTELLRFDGDIDVAELLAGVTGDAWVVVEAGSPLPLVADLGGGLNDLADGKTHVTDGVPDTTDNNGDGKVDAQDVGQGQKIGPLNDLPAPKESDPEFHYFQITGGHPCAFTNPFVLDRDGDGKFSAPGVKGGR